MIPLGADAPPDIPRFIRELDRFVPLHSLLFLHGNVLDWVAYPVRGAEGRIHWTEGDLPGFLRRYLLGLGYEIVGELDPLEGLTFAAEPMQKRFERILQGQPPEPIATEAGRSPPSAPPPPGPPPDLDPLVRDLARVLANREVPAAFVLPFASRLTSAPDRLSRAEQTLFTRLLKASLGGPRSDSPSRWALEQSADPAGGQTERCPGLSDPGQSPRPLDLCRTAQCPGSHSLFEDPIPGLSSSGDGGDAHAGAARFVRRPDRGFDPPRIAGPGRPVAAGTAPG
ncbi:hypothetical protein CCP4SC76_6280005 [Gammaproteobacteria bacterium]